ncbi:MAG: DUF1622 domain-containing protein [Syntrophobacterales bacterium]|jgi:uncharacterized membrane protein|nr:DUF1622 domain-containing protein [Syntrophobacterales bacterium]
MVGSSIGYESFDLSIKWVAVGIESIAIGIIVAGALATIIIFVVRAVKEGAFDESYRRFRSDFGKAILLGLEFLIASDIVGTVAIGPTFTDLGVLALLVVIRTFLSFTLELEISGRWPWEKTGAGRESKP